MTVLFISRGTISGVQCLVDKVCESTGARRLSREDLIQQVSRNGAWATAVVQQLSQATSHYEEFSHARRVYIVLMRQALLERIQADRVIYEGLSGHMLVPRLPHFIRVRVTEPFAAQIEATMKQLNCDRDTARQHIRDTENQQLRWARFMYGRDVRDPTLYDLNINVGHFTPEMTCQVIGNLLTEERLTATPETREMVARLLRAANVEAKLVMDPRTREHEISATLSGDYLRLDGPYLSPEHQKIVTEVAGTVEPTLPLQYVPGYASTYRLEERPDALERFTPSHRSVTHVGGEAH